MIAHEAARQGELLPLAEADLHATGPGRTELRLEPGRQLGDHVVRSRTVDGCRHRGFVVESRNITNADGMARPELEPEEVLKRARKPRPPRIDVHARELESVDQDATARRLIEPAQELHERGLACAVFADDGHHGAGREIQTNSPRSTSTAHQATARVRSAL